MRNGRRFSGASRVSTYRGGIPTPPRNSKFFCPALRNKASDVERYLRAFSEFAPDRHHVVDAERFVSKSIIAGYEEISIRYVAKRRQVNALRRDLLEQIKSRRFWGISVLRIPYAIVCEAFFASRFAVHLLAGL